MLGAFSEAKDRVDLNKGGSYTKANFSDQMTVLKNAELEIQLGSGSLPLTLDWDKGNTNTFSRGDKDVTL